MIGADDIIKYTISVRNTGNLTLTNLTFTDVMTDGSGGALSLTIAPAFDSTTKGSAPRTIKVGEVQTWNAYYTITEAVEQTGRVINSIVGTANSTSGQVSDTSDNGNDGDGNTVDDATVVEMSTTSTDTTAYPRLEITKTASVNDINSDGNNLDDVITYTISVENQGNVVLSNLTLTDTLTDGNDQGLTLDSGPTFVSATMGSTSTTLQVGGTATFTAVYTIDQQAVDSGSAINSVVGVASSPSGNNDVSNTSDDPTTNQANDPTVVTLSATATIEVDKTYTLTDPDNNGADLGDTITYTITVTNTGDLTLNDISIVDTVTDGNNGILSLSSGPTLTAGNAASLAVGATLTYQATFVINQPAVDSGSVINIVSVSAETPSGEDINADNTNTPVVVNITGSPSLTVSKSVSVTDNGDGVTGIGDVATYTIAVENTGNVTLENITVVDTLTDLNGNTLNLDSGPSYSGSDQGSALGTLQPGETSNYTAFYIIDQTVMDNGGLVNVATASNGTVSDTSNTVNYYRSCITLS